MQAILGRKLTQTQAFLTDGTRVPVTVVEVKNNPVMAIKTQEKEGYVAVQLGYGKTNHPKKAQLGQAKGAKLDYAPYFLREVRVTQADALPAVGDMIDVASVLEAGALVDVTGTSKGKGFAGVVKRHNFKGGPRTHGQSDRERAPGSIGQTTTPGRVYKGKRMAGKMGNDVVTIQNLEVIDVDGETVLIKGVVPGVRNSLVVINVAGKKKNPVAMMKAVKQVAAEEVTDAQPVGEETTEVQPEAQA